MSRKGLFAIGDGDPAMTEDKGEGKPSLRERAEKLVDRDSKSLEGLSSDEIISLFHELQVHQIELQMQNEELRSAQEELVRSRKKYFGLFDLAPLGYLSLDRLGVILEANLKAGSLLGFPRSHLLRRNFRDFVVSSCWIALVEHLRAVGEEGEWRACELELLKRDGSSFTAHVETIRVDEGEDEEAFELRSAFIDISERRHAMEALYENQARLETVFAAIPHAIVEYDTKLRPVRANEVAMKALGFSSLDFSRDRAAVKLKFTKLDGTVVKTEDLPTSRALRGEMVADEVYSVTIADGAEQIISVYAMPLHMPLDQGGKIKGVVAVWDDITKRKRAEEALRASEDALREANEQLEEKVRERTAELTTLAENLLESRDQLRSLASELAVTEARERRALASELHDTVAQTLAVAKLTLGSVGAGLEGTAAKEVKKVVKLIEQANREVRSLMSDFGLSLLYEDGLEAALRALARRMEELHSLTIEVVDDGSPKPLGEDSQIVLFRAVQELLNNAVKHAKATRVQVSLQSENRFVRIEVKDDGVGFFPSEVRFDSTKGERYGLFSIHERMQHLGGRFEVVSRPGQGVRAVLVAPLRVKEGEKATPSRVRIVIADDHKLMRDGLRGLLEKEPGFEIVGEAANGLEAVHRSNEGKPDVVIMDINMPVMDGIEATRQIKQALPEVKVIGLTAYAENSVSSQALSAGASSFVLKGASPEELTKAIWSAVSPGKGH
jgi:PAS domain S-box-containing protein